MDHDVEPPTLQCEVRINSVANGFVVKVGCKTFVANTWLEVSNALSEYWENPIIAEKKFSSNK